MISFRDKTEKRIPGISTASLPDIIFMLLFFFMITTTLKETSLLVQIKPPFATEIKKLEKKSLVTFIYIGIPTSEKYGKLPRLQLNDAFQPIENLREFVEQERQNLVENDRNKMTVSMKADKTIEMGIITDVKQELRKASALKLNYSAASGTQQSVFSNM
ncbi:MAG: biopolymer transporter ExbD [Bacteroidales bacterium]|nr:biopolymer transporter ExbD [Bacteroidales bacterium]